MKIAVAGTGYVGLSMATLLSQRHSVKALDIVPSKVEMINARKSPIQDEYIEKYFAEKELDLVATLDAEYAYKDADFVIIAAPTNYDAKKNFFDTSAVESVIQQVMSVNKDAVMVIKSTIPVGFTVAVRQKYGSDNILFSPEFLRESKALYDNLYPSRIIVGTDMADERLKKAAATFASLLEEASLKPEVETLFMGFTGAGLPIGVTFSFLISSPMVDLGSLVLLMSIFGARVAVIYVLLGLIVAVIGGTVCPISRSELAYT